VARSGAVFSELESASREALHGEFGRHPVSFERHAEMRYRGQKHSLRVTVPAEGGAQALHETFNSEYRRRYGHANPKAKTEFVALHCIAVLEVRRPALSELRIRQRGERRAERSRAVYFIDSDRHLDARVFD